MHFLLPFLLTITAFAQTTAIRNATIIDPATGSATKGNIVITGPKIVAAGSAVRIPPKAKVIDGKDKFVIPGLWDMHVHLWESEPMFELYTAHGITGLRDMGSDYDRTRKWAKTALAGTGPRVFTPGSPVDGSQSEAAKFPVVRLWSPNDGRRAADTLDDQGVDFIKVLSTVSHDAYIALAQRARVRRAVFAGHVPESVTISEAIDARQKSMEHLFGIALACSSEEDDLRTRRAKAIVSKNNLALAEIRQRTYSTFSERKCTELFERMARFNVWQVPSLTLRQRLSLMNVEQLATDPLVATAIPGGIREAWTDPREDLKRASPEAIERFKEDYDFHKRLVTLMHRTRVDILAGTDTGDPYVIPGAALHDELALLVDAGLSPAEALKTATWNPVRYFKLDLQSGTISGGKIADLVILNANPLDDIKNTRRIHAVIVRGKVLDRKRLDAMLKHK